MANITKINMTAAKRKSVDDIVRKAVKEKFGHVEPIVAELDKRFTSKEGSYGAYMRFLCENGHTVFVSLDTMTATVSGKPNKHAVAKAEKAAKRKQAREEKEAAPKKTAVKVKAKTTKAEPKPEPKPEPKAARKSKFSAADLIRIQEIQEARGCSRGNAIKVFNNEQAIKAADDAQAAAPKVTTKPVDPLAQATVVQA